MKKQNPLFLLSLAAAFSFSAPAFAQDLIQDTLAVRIVLDQNGLTTIPVSQVATIQDQRVVSLDLTGRQLVVLPTEVGALSALKYMTLTDNLLDALPDTLWSLTDLVELDLGGNRIGALSPMVSNLKDLLLLGLRDNGLSALPSEVYGLPLLTTLLLAGNALDTLPEAVGNLAFLKYLDISGNNLKTVPYTLAAVAFDSLDLSSNILESLPDLITQMNASAKVHLESNRLCDLSTTLDAWAQGKDPGYKATQVCGAAVRPGAMLARGPVLRALTDGNSLRVDFPRLSNATGTLELVFRDVAGREALRLSVAPGSGSVRIPKASLGGPGFYWAELRVAGKTAAVTPVIPG